MSFTALLLPLRPHLTYYQYFAGKKKYISPRAFPRGFFLWEPDANVEPAGDLEPGRVSQLPAPLPTRRWLQSALHTPVQLFLDLLTSLDLAWLPCPLPFPVSSVVHPTQQSLQQVHTPTHLGRIWGSQLALHPALLRQIQHKCARPVPPPPRQPRRVARPRAAPQGLPKSPLRRAARPWLQRGRAEARPARPRPRTPGPPEVRAVPLGPQSRPPGLAGDSTSERCGDGLQQAACGAAVAVQSFLLRPRLCVAYRRR